MELFDVCIIGSGPAGYAAALKARAAGLSVCLAEKGRVGGTCLNQGCIPTKALLHSSEVYHAVRESAGFGVRTGEVSFDFAEVCRSADEVVSAMRENQRAFLEKSSVVLEQSAARLERTGLEGAEVSVTDKDGNTKLIQAKRVLIAAGVSPVPPAWLSAERAARSEYVFTSDDFLRENGAARGRFFQRLLIIGGGVIGVEFASIWANFGGEVTIIECLPRILAAMDKEISQNLSMILKKRGVNIITGANVERIERRRCESGGSETVCFFSRNASDGSLENVAADAVLVAAGRAPTFGAPRTESLFSPEMCEKIALTDRGFIRVDEFGRTRVEGVYAAGDAAWCETLPNFQLAHAATARAERAVAHIIGDTPSREGVIPACVYGSPEIACAGLSADEAKARGIPIRTGKGVFGANGRALIEKQERGFVKLVFHAETDALIGAQIMCNRATDIIAWAVQCIDSGVTSSRIRDTIFAHPTYAEAITQAACVK